MRNLLRLYVLRRLMQGSRHRRRSSWGGYGYRRRPHYGWGYGRRPRSQVRVTGCCLPIPLALVLGAGGVTRAAAARRRR